MLKYLWLVATLPTLATARNCSVQAYTDEAVGWQAGSCYRGTWSIISSCLTTIIACTWTVQHLNIPGKTDDTKTKTGRKLKWMVITVLFPELILIQAALQLRMALKALETMEVKQKSVKWPWWYGHPWKWLQRKFSGNTKTGDEEQGEDTETGPDDANKWTLAHCYYANMGGFVYVDAGNKTKICLTAGELAISSLDCHKRPGILKEDLQDKSKQDWLAKTLAGLQIMQLVLSVITRYVQDLRLSQLEAVTLSFAICGVAIYITNIHKPQNVDRASEFELPAPTEADSQASLVFVKAYDSLLAIMRNQNEVATEKSKLSREKDVRIPNDSIPFDNGNHAVHPVVYFLALASALFGVIHAIAWYFEFPTEEEKLLWRIATGISAVSPILGLLAIPMTQITKPAGEPELFLGKCLRLLREYRWQCSKKYPINEVIRNLEHGLKGLLRLDGGASRSDAAYSKIFLVEPKEVSHFVLDLEKFLCLREPYQNPYGKWQNQLGDGQGDRRRARQDTVVLELHMDKQFVGDFRRLVRAMHGSAGKKLNEEARTDMWPRKTVCPLALNEFILYGTGIVYCVSRLILLIVAFSSLRKMPGTAYIETDWTRYLWAVGSKS
ncbi:hypothetical protein G3M48_006625 [Beauveria asiatica]|uniref:Uncharacterized protein n=1 Tax=Beauveria asiatica TaxID=1069075 RepID=A0AAW0RPC7_9HYPO